MPNSHPKAATPHKPQVFNPIVQTKVPVSRPAVYKPAERATQFKPASGLAAAAIGKQSATWPPVYRPVSSGIQNKTSPADFKLGAPKSHKPPITGVASKAAGTNLIGPPVYRPSIQPKAPHTNQSRVSPASPSILRHSLGTGAALHVTPDFRVVQPSKGKKVGAEEATSKVKINSGFYSGSTDLSEEEAAAIKQPSSERYVTESVDDGEVPLLIEALGQFFHYLAKAALKTTKRLQVHNFTLDFDGSWGPCTGCRERIRKFIDLWKDKCTEVLRRGEQANLTITFTYDNAPQKFTREGWFTVYGWWEDGSGEGPFKHTIRKTVKG